MKRALCVNIFLCHYGVYGVCAPLMHHSEPRGKPALVRIGACKKTGKIVYQTDRSKSVHFDITSCASNESSYLEIMLNKINRGTETFENRIIAVLRTRYESRQIAEVKKYSFCKNAEYDERFAICGDIKVEKDIAEKEGIDVGRLTSDMYSILFASMYALGQRFVIPTSLLGYGLRVLGEARLREMTKDDIINESVKIQRLMMVTSGMFENIRQTGLYVVDEESMRHQYKCIENLLKRLIIGEDGLIEQENGRVTISSSLKRYVILGYDTLELKLFKEKNIVPSLRVLEMELACREWWEKRFSGDEELRLREIVGCRGRALLKDNVKILKSRKAFLGWSSFPRIEACNDSISRGEKVQRLTEEQVPSWMPMSHRENLSHGNGLQFPRLERPDKHWYGDSEEANMLENKRTRLRQKVG